MIDLQFYILMLGTQALRTVEDREILRCLLPA